MSCQSTASAGLGSPKDRRSRSGHISNTQWLIMSTPPFLTRPPPVYHQLPHHAIEVSCYYMISSYIIGNDLYCCSTNIFIPSATKLGGYIGFTLSVRLSSVCPSVRPSVCPSVCLSVCPLTFHVRPVASTVQDGFFPYLIQMINSMRGCVACDDP